MPPAIEGVVLETTHLTWEEIQDERAWEDFLADVQPAEERRVVAIGILTWCVNDLTGIDDVERALLRDMLHAASMNQASQWGAANRNRMEEVRLLFEKIKVLINA